MKIDKLLLGYCKAINCIWLEKINKEFTCQSRYCTAMNFMQWLNENKHLYDYPKLKVKENNNG